jgi:GTP:adenosylcobinamide-phosphate guanylyltransferase
MKQWKKTFETSSWSQTYTQKEDSSSDRTNDCGHPIEQQDVSLTAVDASSNNHYLVIETERWALNINEIDDFCQLLKNFVNKEIKTKKSI